MFNWDETLRQIQDMLGGLLAWHIPEERVAGEREAKSA